MLRSNIVIASCRLFQSDGTYFMVPSNLELHVSPSQPRLGSRCLSAVQWALTFPNLRRHLTLYRIFSKYTLHRNIPRFVPSAKGFYVLCSVLIANIQSTPIKRSTTERRSTCTSAPIRMLFLSGITNWPANLMCWSVLP